MRQLSVAVFALALPLLIVGCAKPAPPEPFLISIKVDSDPGEPVAGANVSRVNGLLGTTNEEGKVMLKLSGIEGEVTDVMVTCPEGYQSPTKPLGIRLTRLAEKSKFPEYGVLCPPAVRRVVVAIRADNGPNLPVMYLDKAVARTDAAGAASFLLAVPPGLPFTVALDTSERADIKPLNPSKLFVANTQDDVLLFDQKLEVEKKKKPANIIRIPRALSR